MRMNVFLQVYMCIMYTACLVPTEVGRGCQISGPRVIDVCEYLLGLKPGPSIRSKFS